MGKISGQTELTLGLTDQILLARSTASNGKHTLNQNMVDLMNGDPLSDSTFRIADNADSTKEIVFEASGITTGTTRTLTIPDSDGTIALTGGLDTARAPDIILQDQKTNGTAGGSSTGATYNTRVLNTEVRDANGDCTLASNQFTLTAGDYYIEASCPCIDSIGHRCRIRNATGATTLVLGGTESNSATSVTNRAFVGGVFTVAASQACELQHYFGGGRVTNGLGVQASSGDVEIYAEVRIWRLS